MMNQAMQGMPPGMGMPPSMGAGMSPDQAGMPSGMGAGLGAGMDAGYPSPGTQPPATMPYLGTQSPTIHGDHVMPGQERRSARQPRLNPMFVNTADFPGLDRTGKRAEAKVNEIKNGEELRRGLLIFPEKHGGTRSYQDVIWAALFVITALITIGLAIKYGSELGSLGSSSTDASLAITSTTMSTDSTPSTTALASSATWDWQTTTASTTATTTATSSSIVATSSISSVVATLATNLTPSTTSTSAATPVPTLALATPVPTLALVTDIANITGTNITASGTSTPSRRLSDTSSVNSGVVLALFAAAALGGVVGLAAGYGFIKMASRYANTVVHVALMLGPAFMILSGLCLLGYAAQGGPFGPLLALFGVISIAGGACMAFCILCRWYQLVPFTVRVTEVVAGVANQFPTMIMCAVAGSIIGIIWVLICFVALSGGMLAHADKFQSASKGQQYGIGFVVAFLLYWGLQIARNVPHTAYCGVFGRWYYGYVEEDPVKPSLKVALTTSYGSICEGSFLVAIFQALEYTARSMMNDAAEEGNYVVCILMCLVTAILDCIGDILEYFNDWTYVQCALRGVSFLEAARITFSLCTCANITLICDDLLINWVVLLGSLLSGVAGLGTGAAFGGMISGTVGLGAGALTGGLAGLSAGSCVMAIISAGTKTILTCWAEEPNKMKSMTPGAAALADEFQNGAIMNSNSPSPFGAQGQAAPLMTSTYGGVGGTQGYGNQDYGNQGMGGVQQSYHNDGMGGNFGTAGNFGTGPQQNFNQGFPSQNFARRDQPQAFGPQGGGGGALYS